MANQPLTTLVELVTVTDSSSIIHVVDLAEAAAVDQNKKITIANLATAVASLATLTDPFYSSNFASGSATATGTDTLAMGLGVAGGNQSISIGTSGTTASGIGAIAMGDVADVSASGLSNVGIGSGVSITGTSGFSVAIGNTTTIDGGSATVVIGNNSGSNSSSAIAIGSNTTTDDSSPNAIGLGTGATITQAARSIVIGNSALVDGTGGFTEQIVIGDSANASLGARIICIGESATGSATEGISIGAQTDVQNLRGVALGTLAVSAGDNAIQLGAGTNSTNGTLQFRTLPVCNETSLFTAFTTPVNYTPGVNTQIDDHLSAIDTALGLAGGNPYVDINSAGTLPSATGTDAIAVGQGAVASGQESIAIGDIADAGATACIAIGNNAGTEASSTDSVVIGHNATAGTNDTNCVIIGPGATTFGSINNGVILGHDADITSGSDNAMALGANAIADAVSSVQIGSGTNSTASTLQFLTQRLANAQGLYTSFTAPSNYTPADNDNVTSHLTAIDTALGAVGGGSTIITQDEGIVVDAVATTLNFVGAGVTATDAGSNVTTVTIPGGGGGGAFTVNSETLAATKTLSSGNDIVQALDPNGTARDVVLPDPATNNDHFVIINNSDGLSASGNTLNIKETAAGGVIQTLDDTTGLLSINAIYHSGSSTWILWS